MHDRIVDIVAVKDKKAPKKKMNQLFVGGSKKGAVKTKKPSGSHVMADGTRMTGKVHTKESTKIRGVKKKKSGY